MTSNDGPGSSGRIIEDQYITAPISAGGDGITVYGNDGPVVIRRCVVDLGSWPLERLDEGLSGVDGARAVVRGTRVARVGKGVLWGNGDYPETDPGAELVLEDCIVRDIGRRAPEAQDGVRVLMRRCVIRNWGVRSGAPCGPSRHGRMTGPASGPRTASSGRIDSCRPGCAGWLWIWQTGSDGPGTGGT